MADPLFHMVCVPAALESSEAWAAELLRDGDLALLIDGSGLDGINAIAHALDQRTIALVRTEPDAAAQDETVIAHAAALPLVWVAKEFSPRARSWARDRGPMTLLIETDGVLPDEERRRIDRFVALLGRQAE
ncbi:hypothetical protein [Conexibacter sp. CPCC 206217]|uniref:hypothetical protein n=1 Tax=Conexibacter sp. CPCC 206217 TaxID=3064574 RepID=UPI0027291F42|nr:hypothetical protein [Conexibacter sp. CPCC 206217]MDO8214174.1 hypothetical protein [Conexibacter sp. CPCC 206217]